MEASDKYEVVTSQLLEMVEIALELIEHDPVNLDYWTGFVDAICMLLGDLAGKRPVIIAEDRYMAFMDLRMETEIEHLFDAETDE